MITTASSGDVAAALRSAHAIVFTAYTLRPGRIEAALESAARRGAKVTVRLEARPYGNPGGTLLAANRRSVGRLARLGADARLVDRTDASGPPLHMKAAVCDDTVYLDDRNWPDDGGDTIVRDDFAADVAAVKAAVLHRGAQAGPWFAVTKAGALAEEGRLLFSAGKAKHVEVESESFGLPTVVYAALKRLASRGVVCRLLVSRSDINPRSRHALELLARAGVYVRIGDFDEKMAIVDGARAWTGSANATSAIEDGDQIDWGLRTDVPAVVGELHRHFTAHWSAARSVLQKNRAH